VVGAHAGDFTAAILALDAAFFRALAFEEQAHAGIVRLEFARAHLAKGRAPGRPVSATVSRTSSVGLIVAIVPLIA
jgi:hypothetical protein